MLKCLVCTRELSNNKCEYDGFVTFAYFQPSDLASQLPRAKAHRDNILSGICFSVDAKEYKWNEKTMKFDSIKSMDIKIADGLSCFEKIAWANQPLGQSLEDKPQQNEKEIVINYKVKDKKKTATLKITPVQCNDFWKIGVIINADFTFNVVLGTAENYATSSSAQLVLQ